MPSNDSSSSLPLQFHLLSSLHSCYSHPQSPTILYRIPSPPSNGNAQQDHIHVPQHYPTTSIHSHNSSAMRSSSPGSPQSRSSLASPKKRYICPKCTKSFRRPSSLEIHNYSHTREKPFICSVSNCGKGFSVKSNWRRHERNLHKEQNTGCAPG
jgi:uncharacterized Zn-finger protein